MAMSTSTKVLIGVGVIGAAILLWKRKQVTQSVMSIAQPTAAKPTNAQIIASAVPGLMQNIQQALTPASGG